MAPSSFACEGIILLPHISSLLIPLKDVIDAVLTQLSIDFLSPLLVWPRLSRIFLQDSKKGDIEF